MKLTTRRSRFWLGVALVLVLLIAGFTLAGALIPNWGGDPDAIARSTSFPGDELIAEPQTEWNHAILIKATPEQIYPWLAQMGDTRGGYYSFTFIENLFMVAAGVSDRYVNADRVHPEWQDPQPGQGMIVDYLVIHSAEPNRHVLAVSSEAIPIEWTWLWYLKPVDESTTRLIVRHRFLFPEDAPAWLMNTVLNAGYVMERGMLLGTRERAEGRIPSPLEEPLGVLVWLAALAVGAVAAARFVRTGGWIQLGLGLVALALLFLFTFVQPALWLRAALVVALAAGIIAAWKRP